MLLLIKTKILFFLKKDGWVSFVKLPEVFAVMTIL